MDTPEEEEPAIGLPTPDAAPPPQPRCVCPGCNRPAWVCFCRVIPSPPIPTAARVVVLHHPHESCHKLSTVPVLSRYLLNSTVLLHRKLRPGLSSLLDWFPPSIYLFPPSTTSSSPSLTLSQLRASDLLRRAEPEGLMVIAFDATWKHAREMVSASEEYLSRFAVRVCLDSDYDESVDGGSIYDSKLLLWKEPYGGHVSTMEAMARDLRAVETNREEVSPVLAGPRRGPATLAQIWSKGRLEQGSPTRTGEASPRVGDPRRGLAGPRQGPVTLA